MKLREEILSALAEAKGSFLSGEELAARFGVSRAAVWKAVEVLRKRSYAIEAVPKRGYRLAEDSDVLSAEGILALLGPDTPFSPLCMRTVSSTNAVLKEMAASGAGEGTVLLAEQQSAGRGRLGRSFFSPPGSGLYMSLLLRPRFSPERASGLTTMAAAAAALAVEEVTGRRVDIKWVNDLWMEGKKVCGILTEASVSVESGSLDYVIVGVGINLRPPEGGFPPELEPIVGALFPAGEREADLRNRLAAALLRHFDAFYRDGSGEACFQTYKSRSFLLGRPIYILRGDGSRIPARAIDLDRDYRLLVRLEDGDLLTLNSGEVSIRPAAD